MTDVLDYELIEILADEPSLWDVKKNGRKLRSPFPPTKDQPLVLNAPLELIFKRPIFLEDLAVISMADSPSVELVLDIIQDEPWSETFLLDPGTSRSIEISSFARRLRITPLGESPLLQGLALQGSTFERLMNSWAKAIELFEKKQADFNTLEAMENKLADDEHSLETHLAEIREESTRLEEACAGLEAKRASLEAERENHQASIVELAAEKRQLVESIAAERHTFSEIVDKQQQATARLATLGSAIQAKETTLMETQKRLDFYQEDIYGLTSYFKSGARKAYVIAGIGGACMLGAGWLGLWLCFERWKGIANLQPKPTVDIYLLLAQAPIVAIAGFLVAGAYYVSVAALRNRFRQEAEYERIVAVEFLVRNAGKALSDRLDEPGKLAVHQQQVELLKEAFEKILQPWEDPWTKKPNLEAALKEIARERGPVDVLADVLSSKILKKGQSE